MLSEETNRLVTQVGPGTKMGALLRRYWHPIAARAELDDVPVKPMRLFGEDLVLYRDGGGTIGLVDRHCPHRRADLSYGTIEDCGLRCAYHGWRFDETGRCLEQPFEDTVDPDSRFKERVRLKAYPVEVKAGLVWAYLGPAPAPLVPTWEPFTWPNGFVQVVLSEVPCNWFQCQENSIDPIHFEWMHDNWGARLRGANGAGAPKHLKIEFDEFDWGIVYRRVREGGDENNPLWTVGRVCLWPNALFTGNHFEWRVPIDDASTLSVTWFFSRVPKEREPYVQTRIPYWWSPVRDPATGRLITSHIMQQDFVAWIGQGVVADRTQEHLGRSDRGVVMLRKRFLADIEVVAAGGDPKAIVRDPAVNRCIDLPVVERANLTEGLSQDALQKFQAGRVKTYGDIFPHLVGQPEAVRREFEAAMGFSVMP
jgi:5,5'-dehydrodivanillate O-demethylase